LQIGENENLGISRDFSEEFGELGYPNFLYLWDIPNVTKDGLPESAGKGLLCVITVLQIATPPYGLIIDLSI
jgi:hypothetical protein